MAGVRSNIRVIVQALNNKFSNSKSFFNAMFVFLNNEHFGHVGDLYETENPKLLAWKTTAELCVC